MLQPQSLSDQQVEERAASATALLNDPVVDMAIDEMRVAYMDRLIQSDIGSPEAAAAHAALKMLADFKVALVAMVTEQKMRKHRKRSNTDGG